MILAVEDIDVWRFDKEEVESDEEAEPDFLRKEVNVNHQAP